MIIRPEKFDDLKEIISKYEITGMMISNVMGYGNQYGFKQTYRGSSYSVNLVSKLKVETAVKDEIVEPMLTDISKELSTGKIGDGKVFVYDLDEVMRIRTGERGEDAL